MNIHEYQGKELLKEYGIPVLKGELVTSISEAINATKSISTDKWVIKSQIYAGGRGKGHFIDGSKNGVRIASSIDKLKSDVQNMLGNTLITKQTGPKGKLVSKLYIEETCNIVHEFYLGLLIDRESKRIAIVASRKGGTNIEEVPANEILNLAIDPLTGIKSFHIIKIANFLNIKKTSFKRFFAIMRAIYQLFIDKDCSMIEINPLVETDKGEIIPLDAKFGFDDSALFRHKDIADMLDISEVEHNEMLAAKEGLNYVKMDGTIGCIVNGAGLAMSTMDIIKLEGSTPANFLDVGGGATTHRVKMAFEIITSDPNVSVILVNIFGGIVRCDIIAKGIIEAVKEVGLSIPLVVRLKGTNSDIGKTLLEESELDITLTSSLTQATKMAIKKIGAK